MALGEDPSQTTDRSRRSIESLARSAKSAPTSMTDPEKQAAEKYVFGAMPRSSRASKE